jgi:hypothetical protein
MENVPSRRDIERQGSSTSTHTSAMSQTPLNHKDGKKKVLIVGAGAAG